MTPEQLRWAAVIVALVIGAVLVVSGFVEGDGWLTLAGTVLTGGSGFAAPKKVP